MISDVFGSLVDPEFLSPDDRQRFGIEQNLSSSVDAAHQSLSADKTISEGLGSHLVQTYIAIMVEYRNLLEHVGEEDSERQKLWLIERF